MTRRFLLMRHAKSSWKTGSLGDIDRPLNARGKATAPRMAEFLKQEEFEPDFVWCSTARRAQQTLELCQPSWTIPPVTAQDDQLYLASADTLQSFIRRTPGTIQNGMLIGHNPGLETLVNVLVPDAGAFTTAACALFELDENTTFAEFDSDSICLVNLWRPRDLHFEADDSD